MCVHYCVGGQELSGEELAELARDARILKKYKAGKVRWSCLLALRIPTPFLKCVGK